MEVLEIYIKEEKRIKMNYSDFYEKKKLIAGGTGGYIYKGKKKNTNKDVVIKIIDLEKIIEFLLGECSAEEFPIKLNNYIDGLIKKYEIMKKFSSNNKNSVECYEYFKSEKEFVIIMELCDKNLSELLLEKKKKDNRYFNSEEILEIME